MPAKRPEKPVPPAPRPGQKSLYRPENEAVWASFRQLRVSSKQSQEEFGAKLGRNQSFVSAVETGVIRLDALQIRDWCKAAGVTMETWVKVLDALLAAQAALRDGDKRP